MPSLKEIFQKVDIAQKGKITKAQLSDYFLTFQMDVGFQNSFQILF
jgi:hypothetical protein